MLVRIVQSILVGLGAGVVAASLFLIGLQFYLSYIWRAKHPGIGAVAGGLYPSLLAALLAFILGFSWNLFITRSR